MASRAGDAHIIKLHGKPERNIIEREKNVCADPARKRVYRSDARGEIIFRCRHPMKLKRAYMTQRRSTTLATKRHDTKSGVLQRPRCFDRGKRLSEADEDRLSVH